MWGTNIWYGKRKHGSEDVEDDEEDVEMNEDSSYRENAILFLGTPISHLPTSNIFAYATHFDAHPIALEWIDDKTCILVFPSKAVARLAHRHLTKSIAEEPSPEDGSVTAKPIPVALWPPEERINKSLGKGEGLKGAIRMRWARVDDVKQKGAKNKSEFYRKYGMEAGKEGLPGGRGSDRDDGQPGKRRRRGEVDDVTQKARLDDDLDAFLAGDDNPPQPPSPPSKMRSDHMGEGRSLLERTSVMRARPDSLESRITANLPRRARPRKEGREEKGGETEGRSQGPRLPRPKKTQQDLDDELDAFLREKD